MQTMDARGILAQAVIRSGWNAKKTGKTLSFRCPRHADGKNSAWLGDHQWGCSACGFSENFATLADLLGVTLPEQSNSGLTLQEYADRKGLPIPVLDRAGVRQEVGRYGDNILLMPYRDASGKTIRTKVRTRSGTFWMRDGEGTPMYGLDVLAAHPKATVIVVEGESDCHAGWSHGLCVVGLPGASAWKHEYEPLLRGRDVIVWQEPDEGGATLVSSIAADLPKARVIAEARYNNAPVKDLCDLHQQAGASFDAALATLVESATPIGAEAPAVACDSISGDTLSQLLDEKLAPIDAVPTILPAWNALCHGGGGGVGLARGWMITVGANTGTGKSLIGLNLASAAIRHGEVVTFVSLEMGRSELATRLLSIVSGERVVTLEQGSQFNADAFRRASQTLDQIRRDTGGHVLVNRRPLSKLSDIASVIRHHVENHGCRYFIVDYLQLAWVAGVTAIHDRMELVAHQLRDLAAQHGITIVALSQFNRQTSAAREERPVAQGLMGGSAIENDSHQVLLFDHSRFERNGNTANTFLLCVKNRHGGVADIPVQWDFSTLQLKQRAHTIEEQENIHGRLTRAGRM
jgi:replicative DNA helicase